MLRSAYHGRVILACESCERQVSLRRDAFLKLQATVLCDRCQFPMRVIAASGGVDPCCQQEAVWSDRQRDRHVLQFEFHAT